MLFFASNMMFFLSDAQSEELQKAIGVKKPKKPTDDEDSGGKSTELVAAREKEADI